MRGLRLIARLRHLFAADRLLLAVLVGGLTFTVLPGEMRLPLRVASAWLVGVVLFLGLTAIVIAGAPPERVRQRARLLDSRAWVILAIVVAAATISLLALGFALQKPPEETVLQLALRVVLLGLTVAASWTLAHTIFAMHYAHHFYGDGGDHGVDRGGLAFPGDEAPDYWDFVYFSFVIGMTCQVSDVQITSRAMRRTALVHGVLSFFFNTVILALAVNLLAGSL